MVDRNNSLSNEVELLRSMIPSGMAKKEDPVEGVVAIPARTAGGIDGQIRVSKDGVIVSYVNPVESLFPYVDLTKVSSSGVGPDVLHTFSLPANTLAINGDYIDVWYAGSFAANDRDKGVQAQFDGQSYEGGGIIDLDGAVGWVIFNRTTRITSTAVRISHVYIANAMAVDSAGVATSFTAGGFVVTRNTNLTVVNLNTSTITMRVRSLVEAGAAAEDVFQNQTIIELYRPRTVKLP